MPTTIDGHRQLRLADRLTNALGIIAERNNASARRNTNAPTFTRQPEGPWARSLRTAWPTIRSEWDALQARHYQFPKIEQLLTESQGNDGDWHAGILVVRPAHSPLRSVAVEPLASLMPQTTAILLAHRPIRSAMLSIMQPGMSLPTHRGPNAGVLRYHLGIDCPPGATLTRVDDEGTEWVTPYVDGEDFLFDDTIDHSAGHVGNRPRVTLFCEVDRPMPPLANLRNQAVQTLFALDARYRTIPQRAARWSTQLNGTDSAATDLPGVEAAGTASSITEVSGAGGAHISGSGSTPSA